MSTQTPSPTPAEATTALVEVLDRAEDLPAAAALRARSYDLLAPPPGQLVVDVGCGTGRAVAELGTRGATAVGVDPNDDMIAIARRRWPEAEFRSGSADRLPFDDGQVAGYRADKVFHVLDDPARALHEARRVLAPNGRIVLIGQDWDTFVIDSDHPELTRTIVHARADLVPSPRAGRQYRNLLLDNGFHDVTVEVYTGLFTDTTMLPLLVGMAEAVLAAGAVSPEHAETWIAEQTERASSGRLFLALPLFLATASRPPLDR